MFLDCHMHVGKIYLQVPEMTPENVLSVMDAHNIDRACLLPLENPEETHYYVTTEYVLEVCEKYPDRFIPFCNVDPRRGYWGEDYPEMKTNFHGILSAWKDRGCKGLGEAMSGLSVDDPRQEEIYHACGELDLPIIFHFDGMRNYDEVGFPRFERMLKQFPKTIFVGHANHFWNEISADVPHTIDGLNGYLSGKVREPGRIVTLLRSYPNLYADLSARSGYNAMTRDAEYGPRFINEFQDKLFFGTDMVDCRQELPMVGYLNGLLAAGTLSQTVYEKVAYKNAERIFQIS